MDSTGLGIIASGSVKGLIAHAYALEQHSRAEPSVEAHHRVNGQDTGRNSRGRRTIKKIG